MKKEDILTIIMYTFLLPILVLIPSLFISAIVTVPFLESPVVATFIFLSAMIVIPAAFYYMLRDIEAYCNLSKFPDLSEGFPRILLFMIGMVLYSVATTPSSTVAVITVIYSAVFLVTEWLAELSMKK